MKYFFIFFSFVSVQIYADIDISRFHNKNFNPTGNLCGLHLESASNRLFVTTIIPPRFTDENLVNCIYYQYKSKWGSGTIVNVFVGRKSFFNCDGSTKVFTCESSGNCRNNNDEVKLFLLEDGDIYYYYRGLDRPLFKFNQSSSKNYYACGDKNF